MAEELGLSSRPVALLDNADERIHQDMANVRRCLIHYALVPVHGMRGVINHARTHVRRVLGILFMSNIQ